jgi:hypothetical protein
VDEGQALSHFGDVLMAGERIGRNANEVSSHKKTRSLFLSLNPSPFILFQSAACCSIEQVNQSNGAGGINAN